MKKKKEILDENINRFNPDPEKGLSESEVNYMKERGKLNVASNPTNKTYTQIIIGNVFTFFNILMIAISILLLLVVGPKVITNLTFIVIIVFNVLIGTIQECKAKKTIEKLKLLNDSKVTVKRNGETLQILPSEIVLDEVIILAPGDQIPADGVILEDGVLEINESLLTGESVPVKKSKGDLIYAGSFIVSGSLAAQVTKVGDETYIQSIEKKAKASKAPRSRLMVGINRIIRLMTFTAIPLAVIVFINEFLQTTAHNVNNLEFFPSAWGEDSLLTNAVFYSGTTITYMIPFGMALLASIAMTTGVVKLSQTQTLAQNLYSVESLSRVNTLCLDKTGTLTDGTMTVEEYFVLDKKISAKEVEDIISSYLGAFKAANQTSTAMINRFGKEEKIKIVDTIEFSSARKFSAVKFSSLGWYALGAPDYLTDDEEVLKEVESYMKNGLRVVLLSKINEEFKDKDKLPNKKENVAMFTIRDTIRPEVKDTMLWFSENDVDIKVISGDNIATVSYIAKQSGIKNYDKAIDLSKLPEKADFEYIVMHYSIFGRVTPDQKAEIISILKKNGRVTGVTGDGLNDLLAFKQADCSIALANGAAATKNVANLILLDSNFANMKEAVFQGRRVVNNIQRSSSLFMMKDFLWLFITVLPLILGITHVIQPTVMSVVNIFITGFSSFFVALEPDRTRVKGDFFRNVLEKSLSAGFYMFVPVSVIVFYFLISTIVRTGTFDVNLLKTVFENGEIVSIGWIPIISLCVTFAGMIVYFENCKPFTKYRKILFGITTFVILNVLYLMPEFFIVSGTDMLQNIGGMKNLFSYIISHMGTNATLALYRTMTTEQLIVLLSVLALSYPFYLLNTKFTKFVFDKIFDKMELKDE